MYTILASLFKIGPNKSNRYGELKGSSLPKAYKDPGFPDTGLFDMNVTYLTPVIVQVPPDRSRYNGIYYRMLVHFRLMLSMVDSIKSISA